MMAIMVSEEEDRVCFLPIWKTVSGLENDSNIDVIYLDF